MAARSDTLLYVTAGIVVVYFTLLMLFIRFFNGKKKAR